MKSEVPPPPPRGRRHLHVCGWILAALAALQWMLFRWDGIDLVFWGSTALVLYVLISAKFTKVQPVLDTAMSILMLPWLMFAAVLVYYMILASWAHVAADAVPAHLVRQTPPPKDLASLAEVQRSFPEMEPTELREAQQRLQEVQSDVRWRSSKYAKKESERVWTSWEQAFADPGVQRDLAQISPFLNEYYAFFEANCPARAQVTKEDHEWERSKRYSLLQGELIVIRSRAMSPEGGAEAQARFERLLRGNLRQFQGHLTFSGYVNESAVLLSCLTFLETAPLAFRTRESVSRQVELLGRLRPQVNTAFQECLRAEQEEYGHYIRQHLNFTAQFREPFPSCKRSEHPDTARLTYWPFTVENYGLGRHAQELDRFYKASTSPGSEDARLAFGEEMPNIAAILLGASPYTNIMTELMKVNIPIMWKRCLVLNSTLAAYELALRWQLGADMDSRPSIDPATGQPFFLQEFPDKLLVVGGNAELKQPHPRDAEYLAQFGITGSYSYLIQMPRLP